MKILVDMNLSPVWVDYLRKSGLEAIHWSHVGAVDAADETLMAWARHNGFIVFTNDLDFSALLALTPGDGPRSVRYSANALKCWRSGRWSRSTKPELGFASSHSSAARIGT